MKQENHKEYNMTNETKLDLTEIKNILVTIQKKINIIEKSLEEDYMNDKIIDFYINPLNNLYLCTRNSLRMIFIV